jgi:UDP-N-acetylglucosamine 1-carboxyvinyltransferase
MMAAVLAKGTTLIDHAAREPEIASLAQVLVKMGARINGIGTPRLEIEGVDALHPADATMIPDRIEAATFLIAAMMTGGTVRIEKCTPGDLRAVVEKLRAAGATVTAGDDWVRVKAPKTIRPVDVMTGIFPGFPTDVQAQWIALMSLARGSSVTTDTIYLDRFKHVPELQRLGAQIEMNGAAAHIRGVKALTGAMVMSTDLRASASLVLAGLAARGTTEVLRIYHLDRGYEAIEKKLSALGARIKRVSAQEF